MSWPFTLVIDSDSSAALAVQITRGITSHIRSGRLRPGARVPGSRTLARTLKISRNTVVAAYEELAAEGWIETAGQRGTFVSRTLPEPKISRLPARAMQKNWDRIGFSIASDSPVTTTPENDTKNDTKNNTANLLRWDFGVPDVRLAPTRELARAYRRVLSRQTLAVLQYERYHAVGPSRLQVALADMLSSTRALAVTPANIIVTRGSQMALYLLARALIRPGDRVAVEHPGDFGAWEVFRAAGARLVPIAVDQSGICINQLKRAVEQQPIRAVVVTPHHQFPTTATLSISRRLELIAMAKQARFAIIEDDYDHEFHYDGRPVLPIASTDTEGVVLYIGSLSKTFAPGLRVGYLAVPTPLVAQLRKLRAMIDIQSDLASDSAVAELMEDGELLRHINRSRRIYRARRDFLSNALTRKLGPSIQFQVPSGGMAVWVRVDESINVELWAQAALQQGLLFRTGKTFFASGKPQPFMRLGFARLNETELNQAVRILVRSLVC